MLETIQYDDNLPVKVQLLNIQKYPWHTHNDIQIVYIINGEVELKMTYARYHLVKNNMHFIHSQDVHGFRSVTSNNMVLILSLKMDYFTKYFPDLDTQVFTTKVSENIATYKKQLALKAHIFSIISEIHEKKKGYEGRVKEISHSLLEALYKDFRGFTVDVEKRTFEHQVSHDPVQADRISRVVSFVYQNYPYKLGLADIAEMENINSYYLSHLFQRFVGDSFRNFVSMARVEMSEAELLSTDNSIARISSDVGFSNAKYYVENFRQWFGCSPKEYRQLYRGEITGRAPRRTRELPLSCINEVIESYEEIPAFTGASQQVISSGFDMKKSTDFTRMPSTRSDAERLYRDYCPQRDCIELLKELCASPGVRNIPQTLTDTPDNIGGTFTFNGMKKPLYYLRAFLLEQSDILGGHEGHYMITVENAGSVQLLTFNENDKEAKDMEFNFFHMQGSFQITEYRLKPTRSCIKLWKQLGYRDPLSEYERGEIEKMSAPSVSWQTVTSSGSFTYSVSMEPFDIVFTTIRKTC